MTARELIALVGSSPAVLVALLCAPPLLALLVGMLHAKGRGGLAPWKYAYALLVYCACVPGVLAAVLTAYTLFFTGESLLDQNLFVYLAPVVSMAATLFVMSRRVDFDDVPGFDRLSGLMTMIGMTFVVVLAVARTHVWLVFGGGIASLALLAAAVFGLFKWGAYMTFRRADEPKRARPGFPG